MKFSVIMASYLGDYPGAAKNRPFKLRRAIISVLEQTFPDWELIVVADGCLDTREIVNEFPDPRISVILIDKCITWDGKPRNTGIEAAKGDYIVYLDNDDYYGPDHLKIISEHINGYDWVWYNDYRFDPGAWEWRERACNIKKISHNGTSNVCHKDLGVRWDVPGYAHDHHFNKQLLNFKNHTKIPTPEYLVAHIPRGYDV